LKFGKRISLSPVFLPWWEKSQQHKPKRSAAEKWGYDATTKSEMKQRKQRREKKAVWLLRLMCGFVITN